MATPSYIQAGSCFRGVTSAETGINISSFRQSYQNEKEWLPDRFGGRTGFAHNYDPHSTMTIEGEISTALGAVMSAAFGTALTVANQTDGYDTTTGDTFLEDIEESQDRGGWATASLNLIRVSGVTVA